ncbi:hypothetical protein B0H14DRAFT_2737125 [Mycena olivaceomarginata]|nr:hypothetical protein B0H14DRAFT_2737125 [Mycena olivaceomarginata]
MHSILIPTGNMTTTTTTDARSPSPRVPRVAFNTDRAPRPISKIELKVFEGEWSILKRPGRLGTNAHYPLSRHEARLRVGALAVFTDRRSFERLSTKAKSKLGNLTHRIVDAKAHTRTRSSPREMTKPTAPTELWLNRKPRPARVRPATTSHLSTRRTETISYMREVEMFLEDETARVTEN